MWTLGKGGGQATHAPGRDSRWPCRALSSCLSLWGVGRTSSSCPETTKLTVGSPLAPDQSKGFLSLNLETPLSHSF